MMTKTDAMRKSINALGMPNGMSIAALMPTAKSEIPIRLSTIFMYFPIGFVVSLIDLTIVNSLNAGRKTIEINNSKNTPM
jgi:hypothetical protein